MVGEGNLAFALSAALAVVVLVLALKGVVLVAAGVGVPFGVLHVLWPDLVGVAPLAGAVALLAGRRRAGRGVLVAAGSRCCSSRLGSTRASWSRIGWCWSEASSTSRARGRGTGRCGSA